MIPKVYILDDDQTYAKLLAANLGRAGRFRNEIFERYEDLANRRSEEPPDAVITDLVMPDLSGIEVARRLRQTDPHLPIFVLTAHADLDSAIEALKAGATEYLTKPVNMDELSTLLNRALEERPLREEAASIQVDRNGQKIDIPILEEHVAPLLKSEYFIEPRIPFVIMDHDKVSPAKEAGLLPGDRVIGINLKGVWACMKYELRQMLAQGGGYLLQTASAAGLLMQVDSATYTVSKHAAVAFAEWLSVNYHELGIRVSCLCPQGVRTPMLLGPSGDRKSFLLEGAVSAEAVAECCVKAIESETFLVLPHPEVADYERRKTTDRDRWLGGMRRMKAKIDADPSLQGRD